MHPRRESLARFSRDEKPPEDFVHGGGPSPEFEALSTIIVTEHNITVDLTGSQQPDGSDDIHQTAPEGDADGAPEQGVAGGDQPWPVEFRA